MGDGIGVSFIIGLFTVLTPNRPKRYIKYILMA